MIKFECINEAGRQLADKIKSQLDDFDGIAIIFIGALGICVRKIQSIINDKYTDPAVICVDSTGKWVIPVLSGHIGGANELAKKIAKITGGQAVVTTQSDNKGFWALDTLGRNFGWQQSATDRQQMNQLIASFVNEQPTALILEWKDKGTDWLVSTCPAHITIFHSFAEYQSARQHFAVTISVGPYIHPDISLQFFPSCLHLGVGCQKSVPNNIAEQILSQIVEMGFATESINTIDTIALKKDEPLMAKLAKLLPKAQLIIHPADELSKIKVPNPSEKVYEITSCYGVAEASALASGQSLVIEKQKGCLQGNYYTFALSVGQPQPHGHIEIVGAGPGDPELISLRGKKFIEQADLVLYAGSLVPKELTQYAKPEATIKSSADMDLDEQFSLMKQFYEDGKQVVRLHTGDPCIYGAIQEQMAFFDQYNMNYHITPGISSFQAAAAELRSQFTIPELCQTIILTRGEGRTPMPEREKLHLLAKHHSTICLYLSAGIADQVQAELLEGGYSLETPIAVCYKLTWKEQRIFRGQLKDLAQIIADNKLKLTTMIVVGDAIDNRLGRSKLYDKHFTHLFRKGKA